MAVEGSGRHLQTGAMRAADADRDSVVVELRRHYGAGRLTEDELSARIERAYGAATLAELDALTLDLPQPGAALPGPRAPSPPAKRTLTPAGRALRLSWRIHFAVYVLVNVLLIGVWAASGGGYFWPVWPILGWGIGLAGHAAPVLAGAGTRRPDEPPRQPAASVGDLAVAVEAQRPDLVPAAAPDGTVTILFSDIVGSTELNARLGDVRWLELLREHHAIVREQVRRHGGFEVKAQGDGFMIAFPSARRAAKCALAIQEAMIARLGDHPEGPVRVRIGLHAGEVLRDGEDFYGRNVALAARIAEQAGPGEVLASAVLGQLLDGAGDIAFGPQREVDLKGIGVQMVQPLT